MRSFVVGVSMLLASCFEPDLVDCGNGTTCPGGTMCDLEHGTCINEMQVEACEGKSVGDDCVAGDIVGGCFGGTCFTRGCGNKVVEPATEQCDDGNVIDDDDCSSDCRSNKRCGNGFVDVNRGEQCEDGNLVSRDGCDSRCQPESVTWSALPLSPAIYGGGTYDPVRERLVVIVSGVMWELGDGRWSIVEGGDVEIPYVSTDGAVYWDDVRKQIVAVHTANTDDGNIYDLSLRAWDGARWITISDVQRMPFASRADGAGYDALRGRTIVAAGRTTWAVSPAGTWTALNGAFPYPLINSEMANDPQTGAFVMISSNGDQAYELTGSTWTPFQYPGNDVFAMTAAGSRLRAFNMQTGQMWIRQGGAWTARPQENYRAITPGVSGGISAALFFDTEHDALAVSTGAETSYFIDGAWQAHHVPGGGSRLVATRTGFHVVAPAHARSEDPMLTWRFDRAGFTAAELPEAPKARHGMECVRVPGQASTFCHGGSTFVDGVSQAQAGALLVDETGWRTLDVTGYPGGGPLAYDPEGRRIVHVFNATLSTLADGATAWVEEPAGIDLPWLRNLAWDARAHRMVATIREEPGLYELDAGGWNLVPLAPNVPLYAVSNERQGTVHMFDVSNSSSSTTWQRTGNTWLEDVAQPPGFISDATYDPVTGELGMLMFINGGYHLAIRRSESATPLETCIPTDDVDGDGLSGCADPDCYWTCDACPPFATCGP